MTRKQIADKYGVHVENLARRMRRLGVHALYDREAQTAAMRSAQRPHKAAVWHYSNAVAKTVDRQTEGAFSLVEIKRKRARIKCNCCGAVVERTMSTIRKKNVCCDACEAVKRAEKERDDARRKLVKALKVICEQKKPKKCAICGDIFHSGNVYARYCSTKCRKDAKRQGANHRKRARKYGVYFESGITLMKVFNRDKGICQICGKPTDWNDNSWGESFGAMYPTVDHIRALANGGSHTWDNVQLAHAICNSYKRDT